MVCTCTVPPQIMCRYTPLVERPGLDEFYLDVTEQVAMLQRSPKINPAWCGFVWSAADNARSDAGARSVPKPASRPAEVSAAAAAAAAAAKALEKRGRLVQPSALAATATAATASQPLSQPIPTACDVAGCGCMQRLQYGSIIMADVRAAIREEMGFTTSGGLGVNKLASKWAASLHKPNQQTVLPPQLVADFMAAKSMAMIPGEVALCACVYGGSTVPVSNCLAPTLTLCACCWVVESTSGVGYRTRKRLRLLQVSTSHPVIIVDCVS